MTRHEPEVRKICGGITAKEPSPPYAQILALLLKRIDKIDDFSVRHTAVQ